MVASGPRNPKCALAAALLAGLVACADTTAPPASTGVSLPPTPADLLANGYEVVKSPTVQITSAGPRKYQYLMRKGSDSLVCNEMESAVDSQAVTTPGCIHYSGR